MKKLLVVILTLSLVVGMFSFAAFADQGNNSGNSSASTVHVVSSMDFNANAVNALLNKDAALDRSVGNTEDNSDKVWNSYLKVFKHSSDNKKDSKLSSTLSFTKLIELRKTANGNWDEINRLNKEIKKAFDKYRASMRGLTRVDANAALASMNAELNTFRVEIAKAHIEIKKLRSQKEIQWKAFRAAVKAGEFEKAQIALESASLTVVDIVDLKGLIIKEQEKIIIAKNSILTALGFIPGKVPAVPTFSPKAGAVLTGTAITIKSPGADVYYTTTPPGFVLTTMSGIKFTEKFALVAPTTTVRAIAYKNGVQSAEVAAVYFAQEYATAPTSYAITVGAITTTLVGPAAGATTKSAITGWVKDGTFSFKVVDAISPSVSTRPQSKITINGKNYVSGTPFPTGDTHPAHESYHHVVIVVTTTQTDRITAVRTFIIDFKK